MSDWTFDSNQFYSCIIPNQQFHNNLGINKKLHCSVSQFNFDTNEITPVISFNYNQYLSTKVIRYDRFGPYLVMILDKNDMIKMI